MKVMTGGFPAEYGNAQSGVINIVTKDGDPFYSGKIEYNTDHLIGSGRNSDVIKFAFGGPVWPIGNADLKEKFTFYFNGGGEWQDGRLKEYWVGNPNRDYVYNGVQLLEYEYEPYDPYEDRSSILGVDLGNRNYNGYNINFKTKYVFNPTQRITFAMRGDRNYDHSFAYNWRNALHHYNISEVKQSQYIGTYDHVFSSSMNLKLKASFYQKTSVAGPRGIDRNNYLYRNPIEADTYVDNVLMGDYGYSSVDNNADGIYDEGFLPASFWTYRVSGVEDPRAITGFVAPGTISDSFVDDVTSSTNLRADFEYQVNETHLAKTGLEIIKHNIQKNQLQSFLTIYEDRRQASLNRVYDSINLASWNPGDPIPSQLYDVFVTDDGVKIPIYKPEDWLRAARSWVDATRPNLADGLVSPGQMEWEGMIVLRFDFWYLGSQYKSYRITAARTVDFDLTSASEYAFTPPGCPIPSGSATAAFFTTIKTARRCNIFQQDSRRRQCLRHSYHSGKYQPGASDHRHLRSGPFPPAFG